jgi:hypothetical protein
MAFVGGPSTEGPGPVSPNSFTWMPSSFKLFLDSYFL